MRDFAAGLVLEWFGGPYGDWIGNGLALWPYQSAFSKIPASSRGEFQSRIDGEFHRHRSVLLNVGILFIRNVRHARVMDRFRRPELSPGGIYGRGVHGRVGCCKAVAV